ncbi:hypothetical protein ACROYT_G034139 [Oculina patagonica]
MYRRPISQYPLFVFQTENKMASRRSSRRSYTREEVVDELFADPGSDFNEQSSSESEEEYSSDKSSSDNEEIENSSESDEANGDNNEEARGRGRGRGGDNEQITFEIAFIYQNLSVHSNYKKIMLCFSVFANFIKNPRWPPVDQYGM